MPRVIAVANQKGGVGKTTTTINVGVGLSQLGRSVILVDFDPQASLTQGLGVDPDSLPATIYDALIDEETPLDRIFLQTRAKIALAPAGIDLAGAEFELPARPDWQQTLRRRLSSVKMRADFILIDCPTSLGVLTINALVRPPRSSYPRNVVSLPSAASAVCSPPSRESSSDSILGSGSRRYYRSKCHERFMPARPWTNSAASAARSSAISSFPSG